MDQQNTKFKLKTLNEHIVCIICYGYLVDATTAFECMHTFCKSCIVKHLENSNSCPKCEIIIHPTNPLKHIAPDRKMQDLVIKIVPSIVANEYERKRKFYSERKIEIPENSSPANEDRYAYTTEETAIDESTMPINVTYKTSKEQMCIILVYKSLDNKNSNQEKYQGAMKRYALQSVENKYPTTLLPPTNVTLNLKPKYMRCSSMVTVTQLKKYIAKVLIRTGNYKNVEIECNNEPVYSDHTLKFLYVTKWRPNDSPMHIHYAIKETNNVSLQGEQTIFDKETNENMNPQLRNPQSYSSKIQHPKTEQPKKHSNSMFFDSDTSSDSAGANAKLEFVPPKKTKKVLRLPKLPAFELKTEKLYVKRIKRRINIDFTKD